jgi:hypothetical protein
MSARGTTPSYTARRLTREKNVTQKVHGLKSTVVIGRDIDLPKVQQRWIAHGKMAVSEKRVCAYEAMVGHLLALWTSALWPSLDCR